LLDDCPEPVLPADSGDITDQVQVTLEARQKLPFSSLFMSAAPIIRATATAGSISTAAEYCVVALDTTGVGIEVSGSTDVRMGNCSLISNSSNRVNAFSNGTGNAVSNGNNSNITANTLAAVGAVQQSNNWNVQSYNPSATAIADPFASKLVPTCTKTVTDNDDYVTSGPQAGRTKDYDKLDGSVDINRKDGWTDPATGIVHGKDVAGEIVCIKHTGTAGLNISSGSTVVLGPATYVIDGGPLEMTASSAGTELSCNGCTIIMTNSTNAANTGSIKITGGTLNLKAPTSSSVADARYNYTGIALMQDRGAADSRPNAPQNTIQGNNGTSITGVVYIPNQALKFTGGSETAAACLQIVAKRTTFTGNSSMQVAASCAGTGISAIMGGGSRRVRLVA
jgi:hypothetical protein